MPEPKVLLLPLKSGETFLMRYASVFRGSGDVPILLEKTTNYLENEAACQLIAEYLPKVKMVFMVREPVERAYSNYLWTKKNGLEVLSFEEAVEQEGQRENPLGAEKEYARPFDYLIRSDYARFAERYYQALGKDRVWFGLFERLISDPGAFFRDLLEFIGASQIPLEDLQVPIPEWNLAPGPQISQTTKERLRQRMRFSVDRFAELTGLDVGLWGY
jgi:hypothetical protein